MVLTNGRPQGIPEAIAAEFFDVAQNGAPTVDWLAFTAEAFQQIEEPTRRRWTIRRAGSSPAGSVP